MSYSGKLPKFNSVRTNELVLPKGTDLALATGTNNNVALNANSFSRWSSSAAATVTGIAAPSSPYTNKVLVISNANAATPLQVNNEDAASTAANRIVTGTSAPITLAAGASLFFVYDDTAARWRIVGGTGAGSSSKYISQTAHGFSNGNWLRLTTTAGTYALADQLNQPNFPSVGVVSFVIDANSFMLTTGGYVSGLSGLQAGNFYYLNTFGTITSSIPLLNGGASFQQIVFSADSTTSGYVTLGPALYGANTAQDGLVTTVDQTKKGVQTFLSKVIETLGAEIPNVLDNPGSPRTETIASGQTRILGRLAIPANLTLQVDGDALVVGTITGAGSLTGSGTITSC